MMIFRSRSRISRALRVAATLCVFLLVGAVQAQTTWHVDDDAAPGGDGTTWATAFTDLQFALTEADQSIGDDILKVAQGTYKPTQGTDRNVSFRKLRPPG